MRPKLALRAPGRRAAPKPYSLRSLTTIPSHERVVCKLPNILVVAPETLTQRFLVIPHVERVLDDVADHLRREEVGEFRGKGRGEGVEVSAFVLSDAARRADFPNVSAGPPPRVGRFCADGGARPEQSRAHPG
jgi:hypothetical protein